MKINYQSNIPLKLLGFLILINFNIYAQTAQTVVNDMTLPPDAALHGVPSSYSWASGAAFIDENGQVPRKNWKGQWFEATTAWGQAYIPVGGSTALNTRCQIRNLQTKLLLKNGSWVVAQSGMPQGAAFREDFANNESIGAGARDESGNGGGISIIVGVGPWAGYNYHFWPTGARAFVDVNNVVGVFTSCEARLILDNPNGVDDRANCKNLLQMGADWWLNQNDGWLPDWSANSGVGGSRAKWVTTEWQTFSMCTEPAADILANSPLGPVSNVPVSGVTLNNTSLTLSAGSSTTLISTISPSNATNKSVTWTSSNNNVATVNAIGLITGVAEGSATITVTTQDGNKSASSVVNVTRNISGTTIPAKIQAENWTFQQGVQKEGTADVGGGENVGYIEGGDYMEYEINVPTAGNYIIDLRIASVGNASILLKSGSNILSTVNIPNTGGYQSWQTVSSNISLSAGNQIIRVQAYNGGWNFNWLEFKNSASIAVNGVSVTPALVSIAIGATTQLAATVNPANANNKTVSWSSSNNGVATINANGLVTGIASGQATITVTTQDGNKTATAMITVLNPTNGGPVGYTLCSGEGETCVLNGTQHIAYGANDSWNYLYDRTGSVSCSNGTFGDPISGVVKKCYVKNADITTVSGGLPSGYTLCSSEGQNCVLNGLQDIAYGADNKFNYLYNQSGTISCSNGTFGDPISGVAKKCYTKPSVSNMGSVTREYWTGINGQSISSIPLSSVPTGTSILTSLEAPENWGANYGTRIRGYITPSASGSYTFYLAGDDESEFYLSTNSSPASKTKIANIMGWTNAREWNKYSSQISASKNLIAGQAYFFEILHKEGDGGDNLAVGWTGPGISSITIVPGSVLSPYTGSGGRVSNVVENDLTFSLYPNPADKVVFINSDYNGQLKLYNLDGRVVISQPIRSGENAVSVDLLSTGLYIYELSFENNVRKYGKLKIENGR